MNLSSEIKCPLCGFVFAQGMKTFCAQCPLHGKKCYFEKCPNCGYDVPQGSTIETLFVKIKNWLAKGVKKNGH